MGTEEEQYLLQFQLEITRIKMMKNLARTTAVAKVEPHDEMVKNMEIINPFTYPEIVSNFMLYLDKPNLITCRNVCQIWEHEARKLILLRKIFKLNYETFPKIDEFLLFIKDKFQNLTALSIDLTRINLLKYVRQLDDILTFCGPQLLFLAYSAGTFRSSYHGDIIRDLIVKHLKMVKCLFLHNLNCSGFLHTSLFSPEAVTRRQLCNLRIVCFSIHSGATNCSNPVEHINGSRKTLMADILKMSSELQVVKFEHFPTTSHDLIQLSVQELCDFNPANLRKLKFGSPIFDIMAVQLVNSNLRLDYLSFNNLCSFELKFSKNKIKIVPKEVSYSGLWCIYVVDKLKEAISLYKAKNVGIEFNAINYLRIFRTKLDAITRGDDN